MMRGLVRATNAAARESLPGAQLGGGPLLPGSARAGSAVTLVATSSKVRGRPGGRTKRASALPSGPSPPARSP